MQAVSIRHEEKIRPKFREVQEMTSWKSGKGTAVVPWKPFQAVHVTSAG